MIVFVGLQPVIEESLPGTQGVTLIDLVIYLQLIINVLCLSRGYSLMFYDSKQFDNDYHVWWDPLFIISFIIAILSLSLIPALFIYYKVMKNRYNM